MYSDVLIRSLTDHDATKHNIEAGLDWLSKQMETGDVAVLFLAGHGITHPATGLYFFLPYEARYDSMLSTMIPQSVFRDWLMSLRGKVLFFLDTCHAGQVFPDERPRGLGAQAEFVRELVSAPNGVVVLTSSTGNQLSLESKEWGHGAFTKAVLEGLNGRADRDVTGRVTVGMLDQYVSRRVVELTASRQLPSSAKPQALPDFPIAMVRWLTNEDIQPLR